MPCAIRFVFCSVLGLVAAAPLGCDGEPEPTPASTPPAAREDATPPAAPDASPSPLAAALPGVLSRGVLAPSGDDATYEVDPFVAALIVEVLRSDAAPLFSWTAAQGAASAGYRVTGAADGSLWHLLGLRDGDVVEALNGVALSGPDVLGPALDGAEHQVTLTVFREDLSFTVRYRLEGGLAWRDVLAGVGPAAQASSGDESGGELSASDPPPAGSGPVAPDEPPTAGQGSAAGAAGGSRRPRSSQRVPSRPRPKAPARPSSKGASSPSGSPGDIQCANANTCTIAKRTFQTLVASPQQLKKQADVVPAIRNDVHSGYKLKRVTRGSAIARLGFRAGDKVTHVNGRYLGDDAQAMALYFSLSSTRVFKIRYERGGSKRAKTVTVR